MYFTKRKEMKKSKIDSIKIDSIKVDSMSARAEIAPLFCFKFKSPQISQNTQNKLDSIESIESKIQQEKLQIKNFEIYNDDSFKVPQKLVSLGFLCDHIITDPPYNISKPNNFSKLKSAKRVGVDFGAWDYDFALCEWIGLWAPLLRAGGSCIVFCSYLFLGDLARSFLQNGISPKDVLIWQKNNPMPRNTERRYVQDMEFALWGVKNGAKWTFNKPQNVPYLRGFYTAPVVAGKEKLAHPTQKSQKIMSEIVLVHTNENDLVVDPFMGSGSTAAAALGLGRRFLGIEKDKEYFELAKARLEALCK